MSDQLKEIGDRLKGLREAFEQTSEEFAATCGIAMEDYETYESGAKELTITALKAIADTCKIDINVLLFADEPRMSSYFLTRKGKGLSINRVEWYKYQTLAGGFNNRKVEIFEVVIESQSEMLEIHESSHTGQEFNYVLEGRMQMRINGKDLLLEEGDSIYYDSKLLHGMKALDGKRVRFITVII